MVDNASRIKFCVAEVDLPLVNDLEARTKFLSDDFYRIAVLTIASDCECPLANFPLLAKNF